MWKTTNHGAMFCESFCGYLKIFDRAIFEIISSSKYITKCRFLYEDKDRIRIYDTKNTRVVTVYSRYLR